MYLICLYYVVSFQSVKNLHCHVLYLLWQALQALSLSSQSVVNLRDSVTSDDTQPSDKITLEELNDDNFIFGNDVDAVDVAVRIAMIKFFMGPNVAGKLSDHTRTLRLYSRPVVALQKASFLKSRLQLTEFAEALVTSQVRSIR